MCLHVRRQLCCPATITWPADLIFPPIQALGVPDVEGIVPRLKLAWVGPPSVKFGIHKSDVIFSGNWKGILKLHYSLAKNISKVLSLGSSHCHGFETHLSVEDQLGGKHKSSNLGLQVHRNVCSWIMSMMELWSGLEKPFENFIQLPKK